ncbi:unnamed protein product [Closterium sp. NIES-65]|nr:unnamed protein product [Closterium sp. NIES-65]
MIPAAPVTPPHAPPVPCSPCLVASIAAHAYSISFPLPTLNPLPATLSLSTPYPQPPPYTLHSPVRDPDLSPHRPLAAPCSCACFEAPHTTLFPWPVTPQLVTPPPRQAPPLPPPPPARHTPRASHPPPSALFAPGPAPLASRFSSLPTPPLRTLRTPVLSSLHHYSYVPSPHASPVCSLLSPVRAPPLPSATPLCSSPFFYLPPSPLPLPTPSNPHGSAAEAANKSAVLASTPVEGREADNEGAEEEGVQQVTESRRVQKRAAKQTRLMDNLRRTQTLIAAARGDSKTKKASKKKKKGAVSNLPTSLTLDTLASSLGDALPDALALGKEGEKRLSAKQRGKIVVEETKQMAAVLSHPAFKANPFTAIQQHLSNTLPSAVAPPPLPTKFATRQAQQALEKKKKKKAKKKASGVQGEDAMEM